MKTFNIDVHVVGFSQISVQAETLEKAEDKAREEVKQYKVSDLLWKEMQCTNLDDNE